MQQPNRILIAALGIAALSACAADSTSPNDAARQPMTVSFVTGSTAAASLGVSASVAQSGVDVLVITKAQVVLARLELEKSGAACTSTEAAGDDDHHGDDDHCAELELAPTLVDLPVNGTVATALNVTVPAGTYSSLEAKIRAIESNRGHGNGRGTSEFLAAHPEFAGVSVRVEGTYNGKAFTWTGRPNAEIEYKFDPPVVVADSPANITINIDLASWFRTSSGALIDPATANAGGANATLVASNIRRSLRAYRDDDCDGHEDHGGNRHGGDDR